MRSMLRRLLIKAGLLLVCLPPLSACSPHPSTPASIVRTERPTLPTLSAELTRPERIEPLASPTTGERVAIDKGVLGELYERLADAIGAVERGNARAGGVRLWWRCTDATFRTGTAPPECAVPKP